MTINLMYVFAPYLTISYVSTVLHSCLQSITCNVIFHLYTLPQQRFFSTCGRGTSFFQLPFKGDNVMLVPWRVRYCLHLQFWWYRLLVPKGPVAEFSTDVLRFYRYALDIIGTGGETE